MQRLLLVAAQDGHGELVTGKHNEEIHHLHEHPLIPTVLSFTTCFALGREVDHDEIDVAGSSVEGNDA